MSINNKYQQFICPKMTQNKRVSSDSSTSSESDEMTLKSIVRDRNTTSEVREFFSSWVDMNNSALDDSL